MRERGGLFFPFTFKSCERLCPGSLHRGLNHLGVGICRRFAQALGELAALAPGAANGGRVDPYRAYARRLSPSHALYVYLPARQAAESLLNYVFAGQCFFAGHLIDFDP